MYTYGIVTPVFLIVFHNATILIEACPDNQQSGRPCLDAKAFRDVLDERARAHIDPLARDRQVVLVRQDLGQGSVETMIKQSRCKLRIDDYAFDENGAAIDPAAARDRIKA